MEPALNDLFISFSANVKRTAMNSVRAKDLTCHIQKYVCVMKVIMSQFGQAAYLARMSSMVQTPLEGAKISAF